MRMRRGGGLKNSWQGAQEQLAVGRWQLAENKKGQQAGGRGFKNSWQGAAGSGQEEGGRGLKSSRQRAEVTLRRARYRAVKELHYLKS
jgi:hypothetical protein